MVKKWNSFIFTHGGPGGPFTNNKITKLINLNKFHLILIDQRGCGKSIPSNIIKNNNTKI